MRKGTLSIFLALSMVMAGMLGLFIFSPVSGSDGTGGAVSDQGQVHGFFTENAGQWNNGIDFIGDTDFGKVGIDDSGVYFDMHDPVSTPQDPMEEPEREGGHVLKLSFSGSQRAELAGDDILGHKNNYFIGNDMSRWFTGVSNFGSVQYSNLYDDIDLEYRFDRMGLKYEYHLKPYADPSDIRIDVSGHRSMEAEDDTLEIVASDIHTLTDSGLVAFYSDGDNEVIGSSFQVMDEDTFGFSLDAYDVSRPVTIDPILASTYVGGSSSDYCYASDRDSSDNIYITGRTGSSNFPTTTGAYSTSISGSYDVYVTKINSALDTLSYSTYLGGSSSSDYGYGISVDSSGYAHITGYTYSTDFPITTSAFQDTHSGSADLFVTKLDTDGDSLQYSTYVGGSSYDYGYDIWVDNSRAYVTGRTRSTDFNTTSNAYASSKAGSTYDYDAIITVVNSNGQSLYYSTYFGGSDTDYGYGIRTDSWSYVYIGGSTYSSTSSESFPYSSSNGYDTSLGGSRDNFIAGLYIGSSFSSLYSMTYLGGSNYEYAYYGCLDVDDDNEFYMVGYSSSTNYPTVSGDYDTSTSSTSYKAVVTKVSNSLSSLRGSTYIEGSGSDYGYGIDVDDDENVYVSGRTSSTNFPLVNEDLSTRQSSYDAYLSKLSADFDDLEYSSYLGGSAYDYAYDVEADSMTDYYNAYVCGYTGSSGLATSGAYQTTYGGGSYDAMIVKVRTFIPDVTPPNMGEDNSDTSGTTGEDFTFSVNVTDDYGVNTVYVEYWFNTWSHSNVSMSGSGNTYTRTITVPSNASGTLYYFFSAVDGRDNWNQSSEDTVTITDNDAPMIVDIHSDTPTTGDPYVFIVEFFDNVEGSELHEAYVRASYSALNWSSAVNLTLSYNSGTGFFESPSQTILHTLGPMYYNVSAADAAGNWGSWSGFTDIIDNDLPEQTLDTTTGPGNTGNNFNFSMVIQDNIEVDSVYLSYRFSDGTHYDMIEMTDGGSDLYYLNRVLDHVVSTMVYNVTAFDSSGNQLNVSDKRISMVDDDLPDIFSDMSPKTAEADQDAYPFRVMVKDNINVQTVEVIYSFSFQPGDVTETMMHLSGDIYYFTLDLPPQAGKMSYRFRALDNSSNEYIYDDNLEVDILDIESPVLGTPVYETEAYTGDMYDISVDVTDDVGVSGVRFYYYYGDQTPDTIPYIEGSASGDTYSASLEIPDSLDMLHFWIEGFDSAGNMAISDIWDIMVMDNDDPMFDSYLSDEEAATGEEFMFKVNASDNIGVDHVEVTYTLTGMDPVTMTMMRNMSSFCYSMALPNDNDGYLEFFFTVYDTSGNMMESEQTFNISIEDDEEPIAMITAPDSEYQHINVTFSASGSTDNVGIVSYTWEILDETFTGEELEYRFEEVGEYTVTLIVSDGVNPSVEVSRNITILDADAPVIVLDIDEEIGNHEMITGDASASTDNVGIVLFEWTLILPDNSVEEFTGPSFEFDLEGAIGEVTVFVTAHDQEGNKETESVIVQVKDLLPPVAKGPEDTEIFEDNTLKFTDMGSTDNVGVVDWVWTVNSDSGEEVFVTQELVYFFEEPGEYNISLRVSDSAGNNDTTYFMVTVNEKGADFDSDKDGLPDDWEKANGLDPTVNDRDRDPDGDLLSNAYEYDLGTDPRDPDTDGDGLPDNYEVEYMPDLDPLSPGDAQEDADGDGDTNLDEYLEGKTSRDPTIADAEEEEEDNTTTIMIALIIVGLIIVVIMIAVVIYGGKKRDVPEDFPPEEFPHLHKD